MAAMKPITRKPGSKPSAKGVAGCVLVVFMGLGGVGTAVWTIPTAYRASDSRSWRETPCVILASKVGSHSGKSTTYSIDVTYRYSVDGREYTSDAYDLIPVSSSGYGGKKEVVDRYPPGTRTICYVDPADPSRAILQRGFSAKLLLLLIPPVFVLIGGWVFWVVTRQVPTVNPTKPAGGPLRPEISRKAKVVGFLVISLFWNGIVAVFLITGIGDVTRGRSSGWFPVLFMIPFVLIGLGMLFMLGRSVLTLLLPRPVLSMDSNQLHPGQSKDLEWRTSGDVRRVSSFKILLVGREKATYRRGKNNSTAQEDFHTSTIAGSERGDDFKGGHARVVIPGDAMHTFKSDNNEILWGVRLQAEIPAAPDLDEFYLLDIRPKGTVA